MFRGMQRPSTSDEPDDMEIFKRNEFFRQLQGLNISKIPENDLIAAEPILSKEDSLAQLKKLYKAQRQKPPTDPHELKLKLEYRQEKRCIKMPKPIEYKKLVLNIKKLYDATMHIYYVQGRGEVMTSIRSQDDLNAAVQLIERENQSSLRLLLSKHEGGIAPPSWIQPDPSGVISNFKEVPYTETCSSCGAGRRSLAPSMTGWSTVSSGIMEDEPSPRAPANFRKGKKLGSGSFGSVHVAHDVDTGRDLALKIIPLVPNNREASHHARGLEHDVETLARLQHPRILQYLGVQNTPDSVLIFMEFMPGGSVKDLIREQGRLATRLSIKYTGQVLEGLAFLHQKHVVHRDIKPANLLRDLEGNVKIADFGSGRKLQMVATQNGDFIGTVHYTAPEVLIGKSNYGRKADIWSVGITLVEMLTGQVPFHELEPMAAQLLIAYEQPNISYPKDVDRGTIEMVAMLLDRNHDTRPFANEILTKFYR